jgi:hypothetical protein
MAQLVKYTLYLRPITGLLGDSRGSQRASRTLKKLLRDSRSFLGTSRASQEPLGTHKGYRSLWWGVLGLGRVLGGLQEV